MRILALDIGDRWIGVAISDPLGILARPYKTIEKKDLDSFIAHITVQENISPIVVGYPKTLQGTESDQTRSVITVFQDLKKKFPHLTWILCDERLSTKRANFFATPKRRPARRSFSEGGSLNEGGTDSEHARAAAFILSIYLNKPRR